MGKGLIHIYCGEGKGKTTASLGLIMRASGAGYKIVLMQCFKGGDSSEIKTLEHIRGIEIIHADLPGKYTWELTSMEKEKVIKMHTDMFRKAVAKIDNNKKTLLVLDEMVGATTYGYIDKEIVTNFLKSKPENVEVVITGRNPLPEFVDMADYVSRIDKIKHPYDKGIEARKGIEY